MPTRSIPRLLGWVSATALGWAVAWIVSLLAFFAAPFNPLPAVVAFLVYAMGSSDPSSSALIWTAAGFGGGLIGGAVWGVGQYFASRERLGKAWQWVAASSLQGAVAMGAAWTVGRPYPYEGGLAEVVAGVLAGTAGAVAQWLILRRVVNHAVLWLPASALAWAAGLGVLLLAPLDWWVPNFGPREALGGALAGLASYICLVTLIRRWRL